MDPHARGEPNTEPRPLVIRTKSVTFDVGVKFQRYARGQTDKHTQTDTVITVLRRPYTGAR